MLPEQTVLADTLAGVKRRMLVRHSLQAATSAAALGALALSVARISGAAGLLPMAAFAALSSAVMVLLWRRGARTRAKAAEAIERAQPSCRNVVVTAEELLSQPERGPDWIRDRVFRDASRQLASASPAAAVPLARDTVAFIACLAVVTVLAFLPSPPIGKKDERGAGPQTPIGGVSVRVELQPPAYTGKPAETIEEPQRLEALEGTHARLMLAGDLDGARIRFGSRSIPLRFEPGSASAAVQLTESGYFAVETASGTRLIAVGVTADRAPSVRIDRPAKDLMLPDSSRAIDIGAVASDDLALEAMSLRYTKIAGAGEHFEFVEGDLPIVVTRESAIAWRARGQIPLAKLGLEAGDSLVYRVIAKDRRPASAGLASSDTFFVEIAGPGQVPLEGFEMPPEQDRYALSQQMIVLKIQRLRGKERTISRQAVQEQSDAIAIEQRSVRANFIFLMGGHVEDEEEEAGQEHEIQEGRLENTARREISRAVGYMSSAEQGLVAADTGAALTHAREAVEALQRAFGRNRYILRTLPVRSRIDPSRRLSGALDEARGSQRAVRAEPQDDEAINARTLLTAMVSLAINVRREPSSPHVAIALTQAAEQTLAIDPADMKWQQLADTLVRARDAAADPNRQAYVDEQLRTVIRALVEHVRRGSGTVSSSLPPADRLRSAWSEELQRR